MPEGEGVVVVEFKDRMTAEKVYTYSSISFTFQLLYIIRNGALILFFM